MKLVIDWDKSYNIDIKEIDKQHKKLVELINELLISRHNNSKIKNIIDSLFNYMDYHLAYEENLLSENNYPEFDEHKEIHNTFKNKIKDFKSKLNNGDNKFLIPQIGRFLIDWLLNHIKVVDKQYISFLHLKGIK